MVNIESNAHVLPKVCILMATFNGEKYIREQVESILGQTGVNIFIFISDDLSLDKTGQILNDYAGKSNISILQNSERYGSAAGNFFSLLKRVNFDNFDFVAFSDQDDIWNMEKLSIGVSYLMENKACAGVSSCVQAFWLNGRSSYIDKAGVQKKYDYFFESGGPGCTYLFTRNLANELKELIRVKKWICSAISCHDWLVYAYARSRGFGWHIFPFSTLRYRQHELNEVGANKGVDAFKSRLSKLRSGWYFDQARFILLATSSEDRAAPYFLKNGMPSYKYYLNFFQFRRRLWEAGLLALFFLFRIIKCRHV